jgi:hypothetical protein
MGRYKSILVHCGGEIYLELLEPVASPNKHFLWMTLHARHAQYLVDFFFFCWVSIFSFLPLSNTKYESSASRILS